MTVGDRLRLYTLGGVHHQQRPLTGRERARDLVGEVNMSRGIDEVEEIGLSILGEVLERNALRLDGDPTFPLDVHGIEHLRRHLAFGQPSANLDEAVGKRGFAVIDVGDDGEVADMLHAGAVRSGWSFGSSVADAAGRMGQTLTRGRAEYSAPRPFRCANRPPDGGPS